MHYTLQLLYALAFIAALVLWCVVGGLLYSGVAVVMGCLLVSELDKS